MTRLHELLIIATAAALLIGATLATTLLYGQPVGRAIIHVGDRIARAGGGSPVLTIEAVEAIAAVTCDERVSALAVRDVQVVRRGK